MYGARCLDAHGIHFAARVSSSARSYCAAVWRVVYPRRTEISVPSIGSIQGRSAMPAPQRCGRLLFASLLFLPALSHAQSFNGAITGVVRDSSHAVIPNAALTLRHVATDQMVATAVSGPDGEYAFRNLAPGRYDVTATKTGFQQIVRLNIDVTLSSVQRVEIELPIGAQDTRVEVVGGSVLSTTG